MPNSCVVINCRKTRQNVKAKCSLFRVPQSEVLREMWEAAIPGIARLQPNQHVCEKHFEEECIVRSLVKRDSDGKILIDIPYKRPRLTETAIPSIFNEDPVELVIGSDSQQQVTVVSCNEGTFTPEIVVNEEEIRPDTPQEVHTMTVSKPCAEDVQFTIFVVNEVQLKIETVHETSIVTVPKPWIIVQSKPKKWFLSEIVANDSNNNAPVIRKSIAVNNKGFVQYYVHGKLVKDHIEQLPSLVNDPQTLVTIATQFKSSRICDGLGDVAVHLDVNTVCKDNMDVYRSTNCSLIEKKKRCSSCVRVRKTLIQKKRRDKKREKLKHFTALCNPVDQWKFLRNKINTQRCLKNRKKRRIQLLLECLQEKQSEFAAMKEVSFNERCADIPDIQKTALREIFETSKKTDARGRRYSKEWAIYCMLMNIRFPAMYEFLRNNRIIPLPCTRTIRNYLSIIDSKCGFDKKFFELLKLKFQSNNKETVQYSDFYYFPCSKK
ncbi:THAP-type domain-containing protein [Camponotus japonicus]